MNKPVAAVVLAAGKSTRMGRLKQTLPFGERTVLQTVVQTLQEAGVERIFVVLGHRSEEVAATLPDGVTPVLNENYEEGMFTSVLAGMNSLPNDVRAMLLLLGDQPQIVPEVVRAVIEAWTPGERGIVIPEKGGKRGHPVLIDVQRYNEEIRSLDGSSGLKPVMRGHPEDTDIVQMTDEAILRDMDTPEDYEREMNLRKDH